MAIISAGVIMNVIFAFIFAVTAFSMGVPETVCGVSAVIPGEPAWRADLQPGDRIVRINDYDGPLRFRDLMSAVALGDVAQGVDFTIEREGVKEPIRVNIKPDTKDGRLVPSIGVLSPHITTLDHNPILEGGSPAAKTGKFQLNDTIIAVDGQPVKTYADLLAHLTRSADKPLRLTVERPLEATKDSEGGVKLFEVEVAPRPMHSCRTGNDDGTDHGHPGPVASGRGRTAPGRLDPVDRRRGAGRSAAAARRARTPRR